MSATTTVEAPRRRPAPPAGRAPGLRRLRGNGPFALLALMLVVYVGTILATGTPLTAFSFSTVLQSFASLGLLSVALGLTMIAGEFDLSVLGTYALSGLLAVLFGAQDPVLGLVVAVAAAAVWGLLQGSVVVRLGLPSAAVSVGGYVALLGLTATLSSSQSVPFADLDAAEALDDPILGPFAIRGLVAVAVVLVLAAVLAHTRIGSEVRAVGGDRRASRRTGVRVDGLVTAVFCLASVLAGLAGAMLAYSLATAAPDPGTDPLIFALTAVLLGGVSLRGGTGTVLGVAAGSLSLTLLRELFTVLASPSWLSSLVTGALLVVVAAGAAPGLHRWWRARRRTSVQPGEDRGTR